MGRRHNTSLAGAQSYVPPPASDDAECAVTTNEGELIVDTDGNIVTWDCTLEPLPDLHPNAVTTNEGEGIYTTEGDEVIWEYTEISVLPSSAVLAEPDSPTIDTEGDIIVAEED